MKKYRLKIPVIGYILAEVETDAKPRSPLEIVDIFNTLSPEAVDKAEVYVKHVAIINHNGLTKVDHNHATMEEIIYDGNATD